MSACNQTVQVENSKGVLKISEIKVALSELKVLPWKVGLKKEETITMGYTLKLGVPQIRPDDLTLISENYPVDSWAYRVIHEFNGRSNDLGYIYLPFNRIIKSTDNFTIRVYYHAAAVSERFKKFSCPAFNHRKRVTDIDLVSKKSGHSGTLYLSPKSNLLIKDYALDHIPVILSIGTKMQGTYRVQIALYSKAEHKLYSDFLDLDNFVAVEREEEVKVASCVGIREEVQPLPQNEGPRIEDLQIK